MKQYWVLIILTAVLFLGGCNSETNDFYNPDLEQYLPSQVSEFYGDNAYYHEIKTIQENEDYNNTRIVQGEVKNNLIGVSKDNFIFKQTYTINGDSIYLENSGKYLNDSDYSGIKILEMPIEMDHTWDFTATDENGNKVKASATITGLSDSAIEVKYTYKNGDYEERVLEVGIGTSEFRKQYTYKGVVALTGYVINREFVETIDESETEAEVMDDVVIDSQKDYDAIDEIIVKQDVKTLIDGFNQAWMTFYNDTNDGVFNYVYKDSKAYKSIVESKASKGTIKLQYIEIKFLEADNNLYTVVEVYDYDGQRHFNKMQYQIEWFENQWLITDYTTVF